MKSPRFLAALAMAAVLTTGTVAHAAVSDFSPVVGNSTSGQTPMQQAQEFDPTKGALTGSTLDVEGDIRVDGTFTKTINNFPAPKDDGHYLRVTMPIKMDFTYNVDTHTMTSAEGVVTNNSIYVTDTATKQKIEPKKIKMTLVDFDKSVTGITTMTPDVEFVDNVIGNTNTTNVLLPFALKLESATGNVTGYSIKTIKDNAKAVAGHQPSSIQEIEIGENSTLKLKIEKIPGQNIGNENLIDKHTSLTSHSLKLKFEYDGN